MFPAANSPRHGKWRLGASPARKIGEPFDAGNGPALAVPGIDSLSIVSLEVTVIGNGFFRSTESLRALLRAAVIGTVVSTGSPSDLVILDLSG